MNTIRSSRLFSVVFFCHFVSWMIEKPNSHKNKKNSPLMSTSQRSDSFRQFFDYLPNFVGQLISLGLGRGFSVDTNDIFRTRGPSERRRRRCEERIGFILTARTNDPRGILRLVHRCSLADEPVRHTDVLHRSFESTFDL